MTDIGLKAITIDPASGYGSAACTYLAGLNDLDIAVNWHPLLSGLSAQCGKEECLKSIPHTIREQLARLWHGDCLYSTVLLSLPPADDRFDFYREREPERAVYCNVTWELERLPPDWVPVLNRMAGVLVPSEFNRTVFCENGVKAPITVTPHVTRQFAAPESEPEWMRHLEGLYVFYTIATWTTRKAMEDTIRAFLRAFTARDNVCLVIKTDRLDAVKCGREGYDEKNGYRFTTWYSLAGILAEYSSPPRVHLVTDTLAGEDIDALHHRADCFVSLTHSEGWGLGAFEALQVGNPVIMPLYGGQVDYLGENYPLQVRYTMVPVGHAPQGSVYRGLENECWAQASVEHAGALMRDVYKSPELASKLGREMRGIVLGQFSPERVCPGMARAMGLK